MRRCWIACQLPSRAGRRTRKAPAGFTLLELMVVTVIIAILTMVASIPIRKARERAYISATRAEMNTALKFVVMYEAQTGQLPDNMTLIKNQGFESSGQIYFCAYNLVALPPPAVSYVQMVAMHRGSRTSVEKQFPIWQRTFRETEVNGACTPLSF